MKSSTPDIEGSDAVGSAIGEDVAVAVLAAGSASRFGGGKLDAMLDERPLGIWATSAVESAGAKSRFIIVPDESPAFCGALKGWHIVTNPDAEQGMGTSIRAAVKAATGFRRLVIVLADMPFIEARHLRSIAQSDNLVFTRYPDGGSGVPAGFPEKFFGSLLALPPEKGAASMPGWPDADLIAPLSERSLKDIDTLADLGAVRNLA